MSGKGDSPRPLSVPPDTFADRWAATFPNYRPSRKVWDCRCTSFPAISRTVSGGVVTNEYCIVCNEANPDTPYPLHP